MSCATGCAAVRMIVRVYKAMEERIEQILDEYVRPALRTHSGDVAVTKIKDGIVHVQMLGECAFCASAFYTLDSFIAKELKKHIPEISEVVFDDVTDEMLSYAKTFLTGRKTIEDE